jgi:hypothetical protein
MIFINRKLASSMAAIAAALVLAPGRGLPIGPGTASAAALAPLAGYVADADVVIPAKDDGPGDFKCCGKGGGGIPPGPGKFKGGGGGKGGGHHHGWGGGAAVIGGAVILGLGYCSAQSARCEEEYGDDTGRYWRCMRRAGCASD